MRPPWCAAPGTPGPPRKVRRTAVSERDVLPREDDGRIPGEIRSVQYQFQREPGATEEWPRREARVAPAAVPGRGSWGRVRKWSRSGAVKWFCSGPPSLTMIRSTGRAAHGDTRPGERRLRHTPSALLAGRGPATAPGVEYHREACGLRTPCPLHHPKTGRLTAAGKSRECSGLPPEKPRSRVPCRDTRESSCAGTFQGPLHGVTQRTRARPPGQDGARNFPQRNPQESHGSRNARPM